MKLIAPVKLLATKEQKIVLKSTIEKVNLACNAISETASQSTVYRKYDLHKLCYYGIKKEFSLTAQIVVRCIGKVADSYKKNKTTQHSFQKHGSITYDKRILTWKDGVVSIWTTEGRMKIPFVCGERQKKMLLHRKGECDLSFVDGEFYIGATCDIAEPDPIVVKSYLGVDLGIKNIAVDSDGNRYEGGHLSGLRNRHTKIRARLQSKGTKAAKRLLVKRKRKEMRMAKHVNHCISKKLVLLAKDTFRGIALENLGGIRQRITVRRSQRRQHHSWSFYDLQQKIVYKAAMVGIPVVFVDPRNTSRTCQRCGHCEKGNRKDQATFKCLSCGFFADADDNAATNICGRALVNVPDFAAPMGLVKSPLL